jgi:hypothetical protein
MVDININLLALKPGGRATDLQDHLKDALVTGIPHGWVHKPHDYDREQLLAHDWDLMVVSQSDSLCRSVDGYVDASINIKAQIPQEQYESLMARKGKEPKPSTATPALPSDWQVEKIPRACIIEDKADALGSGELRLDKSMASFLSAALPSTVADKPVSLFNLFAYKNRDATVHNAYMGGFKQSFGDAAGAAVQFMGPLQHTLEYVHQGNPRKALAGPRARWQDVNLVQYDTLWHYAYMLSTDVYKELNKQKVAGLYDTCILIVSEAEMFEK